jgi:hypothetical protein
VRTDTLTEPTFVTPTEALEMFTMMRDLGMTLAEMGDGKLAVKAREQLIALAKTLTQTTMGVMW